MSEALIKLTHVLLQILSHTRESDLLPLAQMVSVGANEWAESIFKGSDVTALAWFHLTEPIPIIP